MRQKELELEQLDRNKEVDELNQQLRRANRLIKKNIKTIKMKQNVMESVVLT